MHLHSSEFRVRYAETDQMGVAHHSQFFIWVDEARAGFLRDLGFSYKEIEKMGLFTAVTEVQCRYLLPAFYDDVLTIKVWLEHVTRVQLKFKFKIFKPDGGVVAHGLTNLACLNAQHRPIRMPEDVFTALKKSVGVFPS